MLKVRHKNALHLNVALQGKYPRSPKFYVVKYIDFIRASFILQLRTDVPQVAKETGLKH